MAKLQTIVFFVGIILLIRALYAFISVCETCPLSGARQHTRTLAFIPYTHQPAKTRDGEGCQRGELLNN